MGILLKCNIDPVCYWFEFPLVAQVLIIIALLLFVGGTLLNLSKIAHVIAGWPGVGAVAALVGALVVVLTTKQPTPPKPPVEAPKPPATAPVKKRKTIFDSFNNGR
jgi:hypothetical protein